MTSPGQKPKTPVRDTRGLAATRPSRGWRDKNELLLDGRNLGRGSHKVKKLRLFLNLHRHAAYPKVANAVLSSPANTNAFFARYCGMPVSAVALA